MKSCNECGKALNFVFSDVAKLCKKCEILQHGILENNVPNNELYIRKRCTEVI